MKNKIVIGEPGIGGPGFRGELYGLAMPEEPTR